MFPAARGFISHEWEWFQARLKALSKKRRLSFITIHYLYLTGWAFVGSILLFSAGGMAYIDALFFGSGASTQSGLNTIDVNLLSTYQQVVLYFIAMFTNPIWINTFVVFVRLYWFEKRFQHIVREARSLRSSKSRNRAGTQDRDDKDPGRLEQGVRGRSIVVLHDQGKIVGPEMAGPGQDEKEDLGSGESSSSAEPQRKISSSSSDAPPFPTFTEQQGHIQPRSPGAISFTDAPVPGRGMLRRGSRISAAEDPERHMAFFENQRNPKDKQVLRIPGPREADRGAGPKAVDEDEQRSRLNPQTSHSDARSADQIEPLDKIQSRADNPVMRNVTIDEPAHPRMHELSAIDSKMTRRKVANAYSRGVPSSTTPRPRRNSTTSFKLTSTKDPTKNSIPYLSWQPTIGRNSAFVDLTEEQREELGGIEYRALKTLAVILVTYFFFFHIAGVVIFTPWIILVDTWGSIVDADGQNRAWWGIFTPASLFNDMGFTLTPDSFISFQEAVVPLLIGSFLIIIGNTGFPCMLRFLIWLNSKVISKGSALWEEIVFLLDHPRRCFTLLFPSGATWVLFWILLLLNGIDLVFFIILDLNDPVVTNLSPGYRILNGLFQAASTRTAGTASVNISTLHPGIQVSYLVMMYISAFPIAISVRRTNVYEEKSLGIYSSTADEDEDENGPSYVGAHVRRQLGFDLWFIFLGLFIIAIAEGGRIQDPSDASFTLFSCLFEIVSAYGTVGLSLGYPNINASFSTEFGVVSKLVIIAMQIRGRHRGLPYELDRAILLPSENLHRKEDEDARKRQRVNSNLSISAAADDVEGTISKASASGRDHVESAPHATHGVGQSMAELSKETPRP